MKLRSEWRNSCWMAFFGGCHVNGFVSIDEGIQSSENFASSMLFRLKLPRFQILLQTLLSLLEDHKVMVSSVFISQLLIIAECVSGHTRFAFSKEFLQCINLRWAISFGVEIIPTVYYVKSAKNMAKYRFMEVQADENQPYFAFSFLWKLSHDFTSYIERLDAILAQWLQQVHTSGLLNNTVVMVMSDHGNRFDDIRFVRQRRFIWSSYVNIHVLKIRKNWRDAEKNCRSRSTVSFLISKLLMTEYRW